MLREILTKIESEITTKIESRECDPMFPDAEAEAEYNDWLDQNADRLAAESVAQDRFEGWGFID